jgi:RNA polymerase sigma-70 factor, ECF subfamily
MSVDISRLAQVGRPLSTSAEQDVTQILHAWSAGDTSAPGRLMPVVYDELRRLARAYVARERSDHTLQPTALVHEAYLSLVDQTRANWKDRAQFCGVAAQIMRRILVQHARDRNRQKRGGKWDKVYIDETREIAQDRPPDIVILDDALERFATNYPRESKVVELKFFGGLEAKDIAQTLNVSTKTVLRDWAFAKLWLSRDLSENAA